MKKQIISAVLSAALVVASISSITAMAADSNAAVLLMSMGTLLQTKSLILKTE